MPLPIAKYKNVDGATAVSSVANYFKKYIVAPKLAKLTILVIVKYDLPKVGEPFDQLSGVILVEFDVGKVHLQNSRGRISHPEKH